MCVDTFLMDVQGKPCYYVILYYMEKQHDRRKKASNILANDIHTLFMVKYANQNQKHLTQ